jgi:hypothetical protein
LLVIQGDVGDTVDFTDSGWGASTAPVATNGLTLADMFGQGYGFKAGHTYVQYVNNGVTVFVDDLVQVTVI